MLDKPTTKNVSLISGIEAFVAVRIAPGRFRNVREVVRAALRLLEEDECRRETPGGRSEVGSVGVDADAQPAGRSFLLGGA